MSQDWFFFNSGRQVAGELYDWLEQTKGMQVPLKRITRSPFGDYRHKKML
uniref:Uncharacterized protein n=1 Tax=uncultured bacterium BLR12 TaxID=506514 RepID=C0ING9_9BACT|nr:hypothetical protein AKSOIL_0240 [uncultured bacterium BLR12]